MYNMEDGCFEWMVELPWSPEASDTFGHRTQCRGDIVNCVALIYDSADAVTSGRSPGCIFSLYQESISQAKVPASEKATSKVARLLLLSSHCSHSSLLLPYNKYRFI